MYVFTKGKEMEELKELFENGKINFVYSKEWGKSNIFIFVADNFIDKKIHVFADGEFLCDTEIDWEETAKLVKSDVDVIGERLIKGLHEAAIKCGMKVSDFNKEVKVEKVVINKFEDLEAGVGNVICGFWNVDGMYCVHTARVIFNTADIEEAVKVLNALGGNFEYQEVEVIDSYDKLFEFMGKNELTYRHWNNRSYKYNGLEKTKVFYVEEIEEYFNVDLQILKDGE